MNSNCLARSTNLFLKFLSPILNFKFSMLPIVSLTSKIEETIEIICSSVGSAMTNQTCVSINCFSALELNI